MSQIGIWFDFVLESRVCFFFIRRLSLSFNVFFPASLLFLLVGLRPVLLQHYFIRILRQNDSGLPMALISKVTSLVVLLSADIWPTRI